MNLDYDVLKDDKSIYQILKSKFNMSERYILKLKKNRCVYINNIQVFINHQIKEGDKLSIIDNIEEDSENVVSNSEIKLDIIYEDDFLLIINKPPHIAVHPSILHYNNSLSNGVKYYFEKIGLKKKIRPVNRLDKDTSGIIIFAKNQYIQEMLSKQMQKGEFQKKYIAILQGDMENDSGVIDVPIARKENSIIERVVSDKGERAMSYYKVLKKCKNLTVVEFILETGRTHQLRVHSKYIGHPIIGDSLYGKTSELIDRQALHAYKICFIHPITGKKVIFEAPIPDDMKSYLSVINN